MYAQSDGTITRTHRTSDDTAARWFCTRSAPEAPADGVALSPGALAQASTDLRSGGCLGAGASAAAALEGLRCSLRPDRTSCRSGDEVAVSVTVANLGLSSCRATARLTFCQETDGASRPLRSYLVRLEMRAGAVYQAALRQTVTARDGAAVGITLCLYDETEQLQAMGEAAFTVAPASTFEVRRAA